jgi:hypothetical protein
MDWELAPILRDVQESGCVVALWGESQSGKTTLLYALKDALTTPDVVYVTLAGLGFEGAGPDAAWEKINGRVRHAWNPGDGCQQREPSTPLSCADWITHAFCRPTILIVDDFSQLARACQDTIDAVLDGFRAMLTADREHHRGLYSLVVAGPYDILRLRTLAPCGMSPWTVSLVHRMPGFTTDDVRCLFDQFTNSFPEDQRLAVADEVIAAILSITGGHRGWTMLAGKVISANIGRLRTTGKSAVTLAEWADDGICTAFIRALADKLTYVGAWVRGKPTHEALEIPNVLDIVAQLDQVGTPIVTYDEGWAAGCSSWLTILSELTSLGAVGYSSEGCFCPAPCAVVRDAVLRAVDSLLHVPPASFQGVHLASNEAVLCSALWHIDDLVSLSFPAAHEKSGFVLDRGAIVPTIATYRSALGLVLRSWLGRGCIAFPAESQGTHTTGALCVHRPGGQQGAFIQLFGHAPTATASFLRELETCQRRFARLRAQFPDPWLLSFETHGCLGFSALLGAMDGFNRISVVVSLEPFAVVTVNLWRVGTKVAVSVRPNLSWAPSA